VKPENFTAFCNQMERARNITDRGQQRDFLRACVEQITVTREDIDVRFSIDLTNAIAAIEQTPNGNGGPGGMAGNRESGLETVGCDLSKRCHEVSFSASGIARGQAGCGAEAAVKRWQRGVNFVLSGVMVWGWRAPAVDCEGVGE
jgi:hypothetical protein